MPDVEHYSLAWNVAKILVWPVTLILGLIIMKREIAQIASKIHTAKPPGGTEFSFGQSKADQPLGRDRINATQNSYWQIQQNNIANIYWLGHDIMWTIDVTLRGAPRNSILHGLRQTCHHAKSIGLQNTTSTKKLIELYGEVERREESDIDQGYREQMALELRRICDQYGTLAEAAQRDFDPGPMSR